MLPRPYKRVPYTLHPDSSIDTSTIMVHLTPSNHHSNFASFPDDAAPPQSPVQDTTSYLVKSLL